MTTLIESYEQQYSNLSADITVSIGKISNTIGGDCLKCSYAWSEMSCYYGLKCLKMFGPKCLWSKCPDTMSMTKRLTNVRAKDGEKQANIRHVDKLFDELSELLEQMELEIKDLSPKDKQKYRTRLASYKAENKKLLADMKRAKLGLNAREELLGEECNDSEDQRTRLLDNSEKLERGSRRLQEGYRVVMETEQMGAQILTDLQDQRETIQRSRNRLEETNTTLGKSSRVLSGMAKRIVQNRVLLVIVILVILFVIVMAIYLTVRKKT